MFGDAEGYITYSAINIYDYVGLYSNVIRVRAVNNNLIGRPIKVAIMRG